MVNNKNKVLNKNNAATFKFVYLANEIEGGFLCELRDTMHFCYKIKSAQQKQGIFDRIKYGHILHN